MAKRLIPLEDVDRMANILKGEIETKTGMELGPWLMGCEADAIYDCGPIPEKLSMVMMTFRKRKRRPTMIVHFRLKNLRNANETQAETYNALIFLKKFFASAGLR